MSTNVLTGMVVTTRTANEAWQQWFNTFIEIAEANKYDTAPSRDGDVLAECINAVTVIEDPTRNIVTSPDRKLPMRYAVGELLWYLSGSNRLKDISKFSKVWERMSDDGIRLNSAYGYRIFEEFGFDQFDLVEDILTRSPLSRQAVIHIKDPVDYREFPTKDVPCTLSLQYLIRNGKLHAITHMRSNDLWTGFPYDVFCFTCFQIYLAFKLGVDIGSYTHYASSLHLYERSYKEWKEKQDEIPVLCGLGTNRPDTQTMVNGIPTLIIGGGSSASAQ